MIKELELSDPASCLNRARDDELLFVLLGRDAAAAATVRFWIGERIRLGKNQRGDSQIQEAERWAVGATKLITVGLNRAEIVAAVAAVPGFFDAALVADELCKRWGIDR